MTSVVVHKLIEMAETAKIFFSNIKLVEAHVKCGGWERMSYVREKDGLSG